MSVSSILRTTVANFFNKVEYELSHYTYQARTEFHKAALRLKKVVNKTPLMLQSQPVEEIPVQRIPEAGRSAGGTLVQLRGRV